MTTTALGLRRWVTIAMSAVGVIALAGWAGATWAQSQPAASEGSDITARIDELVAKGGSLQDVIRLLGEPRSYRWGDQTFTKDKLPDPYVAECRNDVSVFMRSGRAYEVRLEPGPPEYRFAGKLGTGSSLEDVLAVLGEPAKTVTEGQIACEDNVLYHNCTGGGGGTGSYYARPDKGIRLWLQDDKVTTIYLTCGQGTAPPRTPAKPTRPAEPAKGIQEYDDVRDKDLSAVDFRWRGDLLATLTFNQTTVWPPAFRMPLEGDPGKILEAAKNPGLGVRALHEQGITGKGVRVAIIDQPLYLDHPEFADKIAAYHDVGCRTDNSSMHGPAVASLLVGTTCGTAPEAILYFVAAPSWTQDTAYQAKALDWIVEQNEKLPADQKIRVVSVSGAPSGHSSLFTKNTELWDPACKRAERAGILVLDCTAHRGFIRPCWYDPNDPEDVSKCTPGFPGQPPRGQRGELFVPASIRTTAEEQVKGQCGYIYWGRGGLSWTIPYCAGVLAMGWQVRPDIPPEIMRGLLFRSAYAKDSNTRIINPPEFIRAVQSWHGRSSQPTTTAATEPTEPTTQEEP